MQETPQADDEADAGGDPEQDGRELEPARPSHEGEDACGGEI